MKKNRAYIPVLFIVLMFFSLVFFRKDIARYISQNRTELLPASAKDTVADFITRNYDYSRNGEGYEYTFLEFGSTGCHACCQMEEVMKEIKSKFGNKVKVVFVNVMKKENQVLSDYYGIAVIPTQVLLDKYGKEFFRHSGFYSTDELIKTMKLKD